MNKLAAAILCAICLTIRPADATNLTDTVPDHPGLTWLDLAKLIVPETPAATERKTVPFRHIAGKNALTGPPDTIDLDSATIETMNIPGRPDRAVALLDLGQAEGFVAEVALLCLFALDGTPRLLDIAEVGGDRWTGIEQSAPPMLAPGSPLIQVTSGHANSNENFDNTELVLLRHDRFSLIASLFTMNERFCAYERTNDVAISVIPDTGPMQAIRAAVHVTTKLSGEECGTDPPPPKAGRQTYAGTWHWDAARDRYVGGSAALRRLEALEDPSRPR